MVLSIDLDHLALDNILVVDELGDTGTCQLSLRRIHSFCLSCLRVKLVGSQDNSGTLVGTDRLKIYKTPWNHRSEVLLVGSHPLWHFTQPRYLHEVYCVPQRSPWTADRQSSCGTPRSRLNVKDVMPNACSATCSGCNYPKIGQGTNLGKAEG
jgi:hypothetical protein